MLTDLKASKFPAIPKCMSLGRISCTHFLTGLSSTVLAIVLHKHNFMSASFDVSGWRGKVIRNIICNL